MSKPNHYESSSTLRTVAGPAGVNFVTPSGGHSQSHTEANSFTPSEAQPSSSAAGVTGRKPAPDPAVSEEFLQSVATGVRGDALEQAGIKQLGWGPGWERLIQAVEGAKRGIVGGVSGAAGGSGAGDRQPSRRDELAQCGQSTVCFESELESGSPTELSLEYKRYYLHR